MILNMVADGRTEERSPVLGEEWGAQDIKECPGTANNSRSVGICKLINIY